jgi:hypothetical protein
VAGRDNITGEWHGTYRYPAGAGPDTPFLATITDRDGELVGTIIEPNEFRPETAHATLRGHRFGASVDFTKTYRAAGPEYDTPVDYVGRLSDDGTRIVGVWSLLEWDGSFEMFRDIAASPDVEVETSAALPAGAEPNR